MGNVQFRNGKVLFTDADKVAMHPDCCCEECPSYNCPSEDECEFCDCGTPDCVTVIFSDVVLCGCACFRPYGTHPDWLCHEIIALDLNGTHKLPQVGGGGGNNCVWHKTITNGITFRTYIRPWNGDPECAGDYEEYQDDLAIWVTKIEEGWMVYAYCLAGGDHGIADFRFFLGSSTNAECEDADCDNDYAEEDCYGTVNEEWADMILGYGGAASLAVCCEE